NRAGPSTSARSPEPTRRRKSIWKKRSWACTKPRARAASSRVAARRVGIPRASRSTATGALRPGRASSPLTCGRLAATRCRSQRPAPKRTTTSSPTSRRSARAIRRPQRRRGRGAAGMGSGMVDGAAVAMVSSFAFGRVLPRSVPQALELAPAPLAALPHGVVPLGRPAVEEDLGEGAHGGSLVQTDGRDVLVQPILEQGDDLDPGDRSPPELEEVVVDADPVDAELLLPDAGECRLQAI